MSVASPRRIRLLSALTAGAMARAKNHDMSTVKMTPPPSSRMKRMSMKMKTRAMTIKPARQMKPGLTGQPGRGVSVDMPPRYRARTAS